MRFQLHFSTLKALSIQEKYVSLQRERIKGNAEVRPRTAHKGYRQAPDKLRTLTTSGVSFVDLHLLII